MTAMQLTTLAEGFEFLEGRHWSDDRLWFSDMYSQAVFTVMRG